MPADDSVFFALQNQQPVAVPLRGPVSVSISLHIAVLLIIPQILTVRSLKKSPPGKVIEFNIMNLKQFRQMEKIPETPDKILGIEPVPQGSSRSPAKSQISAPTRKKPPSIPRLAPKKPIFRRPQSQPTRSNSKRNKISVRPNTLDFPVSGRTTPGVGGKHRKTPAAAPAMAGKRSPLEDTASGGEKFRAKGALFGRPVASSQGTGNTRERLYVDGHSAGGYQDSTVDEIGGGVDLNSGGFTSQQPSDDAYSAQDYGGVPITGYRLAGGYRQLERQGESILAGQSTTDLSGLGEGELYGLPEPSSKFFSLSGPLGKRKVLSIDLPTYPRWAEEAGIEAIIAVRLKVLPNGKVKSAVLERTSGYPKFDRIVLKSIKKMRFVPLSRNAAWTEQWGIAMFNFKLGRSNRERP